MLAMQYRVPLPRGFDMTEIRDRVAAKAADYDRLPGLYLKAFMARELGHARPVGPAANEYASFYLWESAAAARAFLLTGGFAGIVESFGRPSVRTWLAVDWRLDPDAAPGFALKEELPIPEAADLVGLAAAEQAEQARIAKRPGLLGWVSAFDPTRWDGVRFSLWADADGAEIPASGDLVSWQVLHLSAPGAAAPSRDAA